MKKSCDFSIILVESALELIQYTSKKTKSVDNIILDVSIHNHIMQNFKERDKRGRPDIIHSALIMALGSRLNKAGNLRIFIHTRNDEIIKLDPNLRIPRNYNRFVGLMKQLFEVGTIPPNSVQRLISLEKTSLVLLLQSLNPDLLILFTEKGQSINDEELKQVFKSHRSIVILIGGFPHGDFSDYIVQIPDMKISIYPESLDTLAVISYVIHIAEQVNLTD